MHQRHGLGRKLGEQIAHGVFPHHLRHVVEHCAQRGALGLLKRVTASSREGHRHPRGHVETAVRRKATQNRIQRIRRPARASAQKFHLLPSLSQPFKAASALALSLKLKTSIAFSP